MNYISNHLSLTLASTALILVLGMLASAIVNYLSQEELFIRWYFATGLGGLLVVILGAFIFAPFFKFKFKYNFLSEYEEKIGKVLFEVNKRSESLVNTEDGIMAFQLFRFEKRTYDKKIVYSFEKMLNNQARKARISSLKPKKLKVPIDFFEWFYHFDRCLEPRNEEYKNFNKYINQMVFDWINSKYQKKIDMASNQTYEKESLITKREEVFEKWSENVRIRKDNIYKSVHYITLFNTVDTVSINIDKELKPAIYITSRSFNVPQSDLVPNIYVMEYNKNNKKKNRTYHAIKVSIDTEFEGKNEFIALLMTDKRIISDAKTSSEIFKYIFKI